MLPKVGVESKVRSNPESIIKLSQNNISFQASSLLMINEWS